MTVLVFLFCCNNCLLSLLIVCICRRSVKERSESKHEIYITGGHSAKNMVFLGFLLVQLSSKTLSYSTVFAHIPLQWSMLLRTAETVHFTLKTTSAIEDTVPIEVEALHVNLSWWSDLSSSIGGKWANILLLWSSPTYSDCTCCSFWLFFFFLCCWYCWQWLCQHLLLLSLELIGQKLTPWKGPELLWATLFQFFFGDIEHAAKCSGVFNVCFFRNNH